MRSEEEDATPAERQENARLYRARRHIPLLRGTLVAAKQKLGFYRAEHSGEYVGGVEYHELIRQIDAALNETLTS